MPITGACCCICGAHVLDDYYQASWMAQFRALYVFAEQADTHVWISGAGRRGAVDDVVDASPSSGTTDEEEMLCIDLMRSSPGRNPNFGRGTLDRADVWGFPFHSACWKILTASRLNESLDIRKLFDLCRSFPNNAHLVNWGHDYGGLAELDPGLAPAEQPNLEHSPAAPEYISADPTQIPELGEIFGLGEPDPLNSDAPSPVSYPPHVQGVDSFGRLPPEILSNILHYLSSQDVVCLKLASRSCSELPLADTFWKSLFFQGREFDCVFEVENHFSSLHGQWRSIFNSIKALKDRPAMLNRKRIWDLCASIHQVLKLIGPGDCSGNPVYSFFEPNAPLDDQDWVISSRYLKLPNEFMFMGSRSLHDRTLEFPSDEIAVFASFIDLFGRRYISGIRILDGTGESFCLRYRHTDNEIPLWPIGEMHRISGFRLALDGQGVRGLAVASDTGELSNWVGEHAQIPKSMLSPISEDGALFHSLKGGFDAAKLVYLAVPSLREAETIEQYLPQFQDASLWYPDIPEPSLIFAGVYESIFLHDLNKEMPLCSTDFRLSGGSAENLTSLTIRSRKLEKLVSIDFHFANTQSTPRLGFQSADATCIDEFAIDGPGGERIVGFDTIHSWNQFQGFQIYTNRHRTGGFPSGFEMWLPSDGGDRTSVRLEGVDIVGFWAMMQTEAGFWDVGVVASTSR